MTNTPGRHDRAPGAWPAALQTMKAVREADAPQFSDETRARFLTVLDGARSILNDQPTPRTVRAAGRRLCTAVTLLADDIAKQKQGGDR